MSDDDEAERRVLVRMMPTLLQGVIDRKEPLWSTEQLRHEFEVHSFLAPFVLVTRRSDGQRGTLMFNHHPRWYFHWEAE